MPIFYLIAGALSMGYLVAFGTGLILGTKKAATFPGGSIMGGVGAGSTLISQYSTTFDGFHSEVIILAGALGLFGWIIYAYIAKKMNKA